MNKFVVIVFMLLLILVGGCICFGGSSYGDTWRTYNYTGSKNVTINIYKTDRDNLTIFNSKPDHIQVNEDVFYEVRSNVQNDTGNVMLIEDYVKFLGDENNLMVNISLSRMSDEDLETYKAYANVYLGLPPGTNYTINYVGYNNIHGIKE